MDTKQDYYLTHAHVDDLSDSQCGSENNEHRSRLEESAEFDRRSASAEGSEISCGTVLEFQRKFDTCDDNDYLFDVSFRK